MDDLKAKWKKAFSFGAKPKGFKGAGHKLGTGEIKSEVDPQRATRPATSESLKGQVPRPKPKPLSPPQPSFPESGGRRLGFAGDAESPTAPPSGGTSGRAWGGPPPGFSGKAARTGGGNGGGTAGPAGTCRSGSGGSATTSPSSPPAQLAEAEPASEEVEGALAVLRCSPRGSAAIAILEKVLSNIIKSPAEDKFRRLRLQNKKISEDLVNVDGGLEFLQACGFQLVFEEDDGFAVYPEDEDLVALYAALAALSPSVAARLPGPQRPPQLRPRPPPVQPAPQQDKPQPQQQDQQQQPVLRPMPPMPQRHASPTADPEDRAALSERLDRSFTSPTSSAAPAALSTPPGSGSGGGGNGGGGSGGGMRSAAQATSPSRAGDGAADVTAATAQSGSGSGNGSGSGIGNGNGNGSGVGAAHISQELGSGQLGASAGSRGAGQDALAATEAASKLALPRERNTQVFLPAEVRAEVSEAVFKRTPADVRAQYVAARKKQEQSQMLMTRETRARLAAGGTSKTKQPNHTVIRVRLPDGLVLQGEFNSGEQVAHIFGWVTDALRDPGHTFELITPERRPLVTSAGTVARAGLLPSSLLNFRWLDRPPYSFGAELPTLADATLARVQH